MKGTNIHKIFLNQAPPISIPSPAEGWQKMEKKLESERQKRRVITWRWVYVTAIILLLTGAGWFLQKDHPGRKNNPTHEINTVSHGTIDVAAQKNKHQPADKESTVVKDSVSLIVYTRRKQSYRRLAIQAETDNGQKKNHEKPFSILSIQQAKPSPAVAHVANNDLPFVIADSDEVTRHLVNKIADTGTNENINSTEVEKEISIEDKIIQAGIEWDAQLPVNSSRYYFAGPAGSPQPYRVLLPGFWLGLQAGNTQFTVQVNPFATAILSNKPYTIKSVANSSGTMVESRTVRKIFGTNAGFDFDYNVKDKWWLGGRLHANFWRAGAATVKQQSINAVTGAPVAYEHNYTLNDSAWEDFTKFQIGMGIQLLYKLPRLQAGISFDYYLVPLIDVAGQRNSTGLQLFVKWPLYSKRN